MAQCDADGVDGGVHEAEIEERVYTVEQNTADDGADDLNAQMQDGNTPCVALNTDGGEQRGGAGADVLTHDYGDSHAVGDAARHGQRLEDTYGCGGGLDYSGEHRADDYAEEGIVESDKEAGKSRGIGQRGNGVAHQFHSVHENGKTEEDAADVFSALPFGRHDKQYSDDGKYRGEILGLEHVDEHVVAAYARETEYPRRQRRADVRTHYDPDGLLQLHYAGVYQTDKHYRGRGRGLYRDRDARAERETLKGVGGHFLEDLFQLAAGKLFEAG